jgi:signal transduction histidine kinase
MGAGERPDYGYGMVITDPAATPRPPLVARLWPQLADRLAHRAGPDLVDCVVATGCFAAFTVPVLLGAGPAHPHSPEAAFGVIAAAPLIVRRRWPVTVLLVVAAVYVAAALADVAFTPFVSNAGPNLAIAVFTAAGLGRRPWALTAAVVAGAATWASLPIALHLRPHHDQDAVQLVAVIVGWLAGDLARALREYRQQLQLVHSRRAVEELRLARAEERLRLSREVHDVVSHSLSAIAVQAGVARLVFAEQPDQAGAALSAIESASRLALDELRRLLRQIRDPRDPREAAAPTLSDLPGLIGRLGRAGLNVSYRSTGEPRPYGTGVELSAYRIAQEALTNVTKHAPGARATVEIDCGAAWLTVTVADDGGQDRARSAAELTVAVAGDGGQHPVRSADGAGLGIPGMRERAELLGGTLTAGPAAGGGFAVVARLPAKTGRGAPPSEPEGSRSPDQHRPQGHEGRR